MSLYYGVVLKAKAIMIPAMLPNKKELPGSRAPRFNTIIPDLFHEVMKHHDEWVAHARILDQGERPLKKRKGYHG